MVLLRLAAGRFPQCVRRKEGDRGVAREARGISSVKCVGGIRHPFRVRTWHGWRPVVSLRSTTGYNPLHLRRKESGSRGAGDQSDAGNPLNGCTLASGTPSGCGLGVGGVRWCRFAQPPATVHCTSGVRRVDREVHDQGDGENPSVSCIVGLQHLLIQGVDSDLRRDLTAGTRPGARLRPMVSLRLAAGRFPQCVLRKEGDRGVARQARGISSVKCGAGIRHPFRVRT